MRIHFVCMAAIGLTIVGCNLSPPEPAGPTNVLSQPDPFVAARRDTRSAEHKYLDAAKPMLEALAKRDYVRFHGFLSQDARLRFNPYQFVPHLDPTTPAPPAAPLENLDQQQFLTWMKKTEELLGAPHSVMNVEVFTTDPEILSGKGDRLTAMFAIGAMPATIPAAIRRASIRTSIRCDLRDDAVKQIAADLKISEEQVRAGDWPENGDYTGEEWPYLNLKFVLVEEDQQLRIGYFEFMPPSILD